MFYTPQTSCMNSQILAGGFTSSVKTIVEACLKQPGWLNAYTNNLSVILSKQKRLLHSVFYLLHNVNLHNFPVYLLPTY